MSPPHLWRPLTRWSFDSPRGYFEQELFNLGATSLIHDAQGLLVGCYVDDQTPERDTAAQKIRAIFPGVIFVGIRADEAGHKVANCTTALEWYPFYGYEDVPLPSAQAYIVQRTYRYDPSDPGVFRAELPVIPRRKWLGLYLRALTRSKYVMTY